VAARTVSLISQSAKYLTCTFHAIITLVGWGVAPFLPVPGRPLAQGRLYYFSNDAS